MSAALAIAQPRRIKATRRRRRKIASGHFVQRYYDPAIGRFLSVDPMASDMNNGWNFNRYNYAANNPYKFTDPDGRVVNVIVGAGIGAGLDLAIQLTEMAMDKRTEIDKTSIAISAGTGALGVGLAGKFGKIGELLVDAAISAGSTTAKGEKVTLTSVVVDVAFGGAAKGKAATAINSSPATRIARREANRLERIGNKPGARPSQRARAENATKGVNEAVAQSAAPAGIVASSIGSAVERNMSEPAEAASNE